ncbi:hypothetical protein HYE22_00880 [Mycoplasmopsis bovis]|nr:hypothetical protein [Mycoplasmopsis bovis]QQH24059.1 hypothetical protein HYE22_00880 [Mycoplasmopsis bovis]
MTKILIIQWYLLKKKLNVHGKYKFNYVHYELMKELRWKLPSKSKTNKNNISPWDLKKFWKANCRLDMKSFNIVGLNQDNL